MRRKLRCLHKVRLVVVVLAVLGSTLALTACSQSVSTSSSTCGLVYGDGSGDHGAQLKRMIYPGEVGTYDDQSDSVRYVPCGPRNYLVTPPNSKDANGNEIGDIHTPIDTYLKTKAHVLVWVNVKFQLNQDPEAMKEFSVVCQKFGCDEGISGSEKVNNATPGWNDMLGEVFWPSLQSIARSAIYDMPDTVWSDHDIVKYNELGVAMSKSFADAVIAATGQDLPLFCGTGKSSGWDKDHKHFTCTNVGIEVTNVENATADQQKTADAAAQANKTRDLNAQLLDAARAKYGSDAGFWLGVLDAINACNGKTGCNISVGRPVTAQ